MYDQVQFWYLNKFKVCVVLPVGTISKLFEGCALRLVSPTEKNNTKSIIILNEGRYLDYYA